MKETLVLLAGISVGIITALATAVIADWFSGHEKLLAASTIAGIIAYVFFIYAMYGELKAW